MSSAGPTRGQRWAGEAEPNGAMKTWLRLPTLAPVTEKSMAPELEPRVVDSVSPPLGGLHMKPIVEPCQLL
jgi:hypothetical protein